MAGAVRGIYQATARAGGATDVWEAVRSVADGEEKPDRMKGTQTFSPVVPLLDADMIAALATARGISADDAFSFLFTERERTIASMKLDPLRHGYIPSIWRVCTALLNVPWLKEEEADWARQMREHLGFQTPVRSLLILGGNRSSKTRFECWLAMQHLAMQRREDMDPTRCWLFHTTHQNSVDYHHHLMWELLPIEWRRKTKTQTQFFSHSEQMGFSSNKFITPDKGECSFRNYSQDRTDAIEGGEPSVACADETIAGDWVETLEIRLSNRNGILVVGFTPVDGYSATVRMFCDGATTAKTATAFLMPLDGGLPREDLALGLDPEEFAEVGKALEEQRPPRCAPCRPQRCEDWLTGGTGEQVTPEGRKFETVPRVLRCRDPKKAVVYFHSSDNPFGNPAEVIGKVRLKPPTFKRERYYGIAEKLVGARFHTFTEKIHVVKAEAVPAAGTNWHMIDPCSGRAWFQLWIRATPDDKHFVYREWPGNYHIPGIGVPEAWADPSSGKRQDGQRGKGQKAPGWGLSGYKREIARLEGWLAPLARGSSPAELWRMEKPDGKSEEEWVRSWDDQGLKREAIFARYMDARFGNVKGFTEGGMRTLIEALYEDVGLEVLDTATGGGSWTIEDGCEMVDSALAYNTEKPLDFFNQPHLYISEECQNLIFALKVWTGEDGGEGATKDPIDALRYYFLKRCRYMGEDWKGNGGFVGGGGVY